MGRSLSFSGLLGLAFLPLGGCIGEIGLVEGLAGGLLALVVLFVALLYAAPAALDRLGRRAWRERMRNRRPWSRTRAKPRTRRRKRA